MKRRALVFLASSLVAATAIVPTAQATIIGPATQITDFSPGRSNLTAAGRFHATAANPQTGDQIAVYYAYGDSAYLGAQLFDAQGPVGPEQVIATTGPDSYYSYSVAYNPSTGGWMVGLQDTQNNEIDGQLLNADGSTSGSAFTVGTGEQGYAGVKVVWNSTASKFLFSWTSYYEADMKGRFVSGSGTPQGSELTLITFDDPDEYCPMDSAYSPQENTFLNTVGGQCAYYFDPAYPAVSQLLSGGTAAPVGSPNLLGPLAVNSFNYAPSVAYNAKANEFGVVWHSRPDLDQQFELLLQRMNASTGAEIGAPVEITPPEGMLPYYRRVRVSASPVTGHYYITPSLLQGTSSNPDGWYSFKVTSTGATVADSLENLASGVDGPYRPQNLYNPKTCRFVTTFVGQDPVTDDYNLYANGADPEPAPCGKPSLKKKGTAGATSLKVRVGCASAGSCRIKLSGKLVGGKGKVKGVTSKGSGKRTVTLSYSRKLIRELRRNGGGKIRITSKEVGGGSRSITVTVPAPVTG